MRHDVSHAQKMLSGRSTMSGNADYYINH